jgi:hypothetical protein
MPMLRDLFISSNSVTDRCLGALGHALAAHHGHCKTASAIGCSPSHLERLSLNDNNISDDGLIAFLEAIRDNGGTALRELSLDGNPQLCRRTGELLAAMEAAVVARRGPTASLSSLVTQSQAQLRQKPLVLSLRTRRCQNRALTERVEALGYGQYAETSVLRPNATYSVSRKHTAIWQVIKIRT